MIRNSPPVDNRVVASEHRLTRFIAVRLRALFDCSCYRHVVAGVNVMQLHLTMRTVKKVLISMYVLVLRLTLVCVSISYLCI